MKQNLDMKKLTYPQEEARCLAHELHHQRRGDHQIPVNKEFKENRMFTNTIIR